MKSYNQQLAQHRAVVKDPIDKLGTYEKAKVYLCSMAISIRWQGGGAHEGHFLLFFYLRREVINQRRKLKKSNN